MNYSVKFQILPPTPLPSSIGITPGSAVPQNKILRFQKALTLKLKHAS